MKLATYGQWSATDPDFDSADWRDFDEPPRELVPSRDPGDDTAAHGLELTFRKLVERWKEESRFLSSPTDMVLLPSSVAIMAMGKAAVPLILKELEREPDHWFIALEQLTGEDPVPESSYGNLDMITKAWLDWGKAKGII